MQSAVKGTVLVLMVGAFAPSLAQPNQTVITLERSICFGNCPAYLLQIDSSGAVSFWQGPPPNRHEERRSSITTDQLQDLVEGFTAIHFFDLNDQRQQECEDGPTTYIGLTLKGKAKQIAHCTIAPPGIEELERKIERTTSVHHWLHGDARRFTLQSPVSGPQMGGGEDLKNEMFVRNDARNGIKPGLNPLMQAAGLGNVPGIRRMLQQGEDVNAGDETGWTALMIAAVAAQPQSASVVLDAGARVDQRDRHGNTALIGAAAVRFGNLRMAAEVVGILLVHGAAVDATNDLGESPLMWAARSGNPESIEVLLKAGANPALVDQSGHDALFYLRNARDALTFDKPSVDRYDRSELVLEQR
jgi:hypothetical protein